MILKADIRSAIQWWKDLHWAIRIPATVGLFFLLAGAVIYAVARIGVLTGISGYLRCRGYGFRDSFRAIQRQYRKDRQREIRREEYRQVVERLKEEMEELDGEISGSTERERNAKQKIHGCGNDADCVDREFERYRATLGKDED